MKQLSKCEEDRESGGDYAENRDGERCRVREGKIKQNMKGERCKRGRQKCGKQKRLSGRQKVTDEEWRETAQRRENVMKGELVAGD